jgi:hypothetical protein
MCATEPDLGSVLLKDKPPAQGIIYSVIIKRVQYTAIII